jgi:anti-sigma regulatory factor (Ser/Thr protein kinase)
VEEMIYREGTQKTFSICHSSDISAARRYGLQLAQSLGFDETTSGRLSLIITEAATNILKHADDGQLFLTYVLSGQTKGIEILALDKGSIYKVDPSVKTIMSRV